jgi:hypothetical protein
MRLTNEGRLGIGTTSPSAKLHIHNTSTTSDGDGTADESPTGQDSILLYGHGGTEDETYGSITWLGGSRRRAMITAVAENNDTDFVGLAFYTQGTDGSGDFNESMRISRSGNVGIGRLSPSDKLEVDGSISLKAASATDAHYIHMPRGGGITFYGDANQHHGIFSRDQSNTAAKDDILISTYGALYVDLDSNDNNSASADFIVGKHNSTSNNLFNLSGETGNLTILGNITAYGSPSDLRLKENIATIENPLDKVSQLRGVTFNYKEDGSKSTGLIAQELEKVLPEVVYETEDINDSDNKFKAVRYGNVVGLLVEAIKELKAEVEELKKNSHPPKGLHDLDGSKDILEKIKKLEEKYA